MSELLKIVLTAGLTIIGGVVVFTCGQLIERFFIEPAHELSRLIGEIGDSLVFYSDRYSNPGVGSPEAMEEAHTVLRQRASQLRARAQAVRGHELWRAVGVLPGSASVTEASRGLIYLSNAIHQGQAERNLDTAERIRELLRIRESA